MEVKKAILFCSPKLPFLFLSFFLQRCRLSQLTKPEKEFGRFILEAFSVNLVSHSKGKVRGKIMARVMGCHTRQDRLAYIQSEVG